MCVTNFNNDGDSPRARIWMSVACSEIYAAGDNVQIETIYLYEHIFNCFKYWIVKPAYLSVPLIWIPFQFNYYTHIWSSGWKLCHQSGETQTKGASIRWRSAQWISRGRPVKSQPYFWCHLLFIISCYFHFPDWAVFSISSSINEIFIDVFTIRQKQQLIIISLTITCICRNRQKSIWGISCCR